MRILVIEDDRVMARAIALMLNDAGFEYETVGQGEAGIELARLYDYAAIILDLSLPDVYGYEVLKQLRLARVSTPVMIVSGDSQTATKVAGFGGGADDYMIKPFARDELIARLYALIRRSQGHAELVIRTGTMVVDLKAQIVTVRDRRIMLTKTEYAILEILSLRKGVTLAKEVFLTHLYGGREEPDLKIIDVFICKIRKKLATIDLDAASRIETVWGRGYTLRDPELQRLGRAA